MSRNCLHSLCLKLTAVLAVALFGLIAAPNSAYALCSQPDEEDSWQNADPNTRSITRIDLRFTCQDQILNGELYPPGPPWHMHIWGKCHPSNCNWGEIGAENVTMGDRHYIYGVYHQGFATRYVYADMSLYRPGQLWVYMWTDFADPGRPDYESQNWFTRR